MDYAGFKVASDSDLDTFARRIEERGTKVEEVAAGEQPGLGRRLSFIVSTGHKIELFSEMALSALAWRTEVTTSPSTSRTGELLARLTGAEAGLVDLMTPTLRY